MDTKGFIYRLLGFGTDTNPLESKGLWTLLVGAAWALAVYFGGLDSADPLAQQAAADAAGRVLLSASAVAGWLRTVSAFFRRK